MEILKDRIVLFSLKPKFWSLIITGDKIWEFRKYIPQCLEEGFIKEIWIYESFPIKRIVGKLSIDKIIKENPSKLYEQLHQSKIGVEKTFFDKYFQFKPFGYALHIEKFEVFVSSMQLTVSPPQNFRYLERKDIEGI